MKPIKLNKKLNYVEKTLALTCLLMFVIIIGISLNSTVMIANGGRMPFYYEEVIYEDSTHFSFQDYSEIKYPYLSDIFKVSFHDGIFSMGDVFLWFSLVLLCYVSWRDGRIIYTFYKMRKNGNKS